MNRKTLKILQWNIRSINTNFLDLTGKLQQYNPEVVALSETFLRESKKLKISNYNILRKDRDDGKGGIAFLIKSNIMYEEITIHVSVCSPNFQYQAVRINGIVIVNLYNPPNIKLKASNLNEIIKQIGTKYMLIGDFNAQSPRWGSHTRNFNGKVIDEMLDEKELIVLNDGTVTRCTPPQIGNSAPDLSIVSLNLANKCSWTVLFDPAQSDHYPILIEINVGNKSIVTNLYFTTKKFKTEKADWEGYNTKIENELEYSDCHNLDEFNKLLIHSAEEKFPTKKISYNNKYRVIWWDEELSNMIELRRDIIREYSNNPTQELYIKANNTRAKVKLIMKKKKKDSFTKFCENINFLPLTSAWKSIKKFKNHESNINVKNLPTEEILDQLMTNLSKPINTKISQIRKENISEQNQSNPFSFFELELALKNRKNSSPGLDALTYDMYTNLSKKLKIKFLNIMNEILKNPVNIKGQNKILVLPFNKPNKPLLNMDSIRPIALSLCSIKILESLIKNRIENIIEKSLNQNKLMFGFRRMKSVNDSLVYLTSRIYTGFAEKKFTVVVFLDIKGAYDSVNIDILLEDLREINIPSDIIGIIDHLLNNKEMYIQCTRENRIMGPYFNSKGILQGSKLSTFLFNLYVKNVIKCKVKGVEIGQYADDKYIICTGSDIGDIYEKITKTLDNINSFLSSRNLIISVEKTYAMLFARKKTPKILPCLTIGNQNIMWKNQVKYLGVILDPKLEWSLQIEQANCKAKRGIDIVKCLCKTWWGAQPQSLLNLYKAISRVHLDYCSMIYGGSKTTINKMNSIHYQGIRTAMGYMRSTPINIILAESGETTLEKRRELLASKYILKNLQVKNNIIIDQINKLNSHQHFWNKKYKPAYLTALQNVREFKNNIYKAEQIPFYSLDYIQHSAQCDIDIPDFGKKEPDTKIKFKNYCENKFENFQSFYTDASLKNINGNISVGIGIYSPSLPLEYSRKLPSYWSIYSAELLAIGKALEIIKNQNITKAVIFSDSLSALLTLKNWKLDSSIDTITATVKQIWADLSNDNKIIKGVWIPSHSEIIGNDKADHLANKGRHGELLNYKGGPQFMYNIIKDKIRENWIRTLQKWGRNKGRTYTHMRNRDKKCTIDKPYKLLKNNLTRKHITTMMRLRSGHCLTPEHLYTIKINSSPNCECGKVGSLVHVFFECNLNVHNINTLYTKLEKFEIQRPINIYEVIFTDSIDIVQILNEFLECSDIKI